MTDQPAPAGAPYFLHKVGTRRKHRTLEAAQAAASRVAAAEGETFVISQEVGRVNAPERANG